MKLGLAFVGLALACVGWSKSEFATNISFGGTPVGTNVTTIGDDGVFVSKSDMDLGGTKFSEEISTKFINGKFGDIESVIRQGDRVIRISIKGKVVTVDDGKSKKIQTLASDPKAYFANFHPQFCRSMADLIPASGSLETDILILDSGTMVKGTFAAKASRIVKLDGSSFSADFYELSLFGLKVEVGVDSRDGWVLGLNVPAQNGLYLRKGVVDLFVDPLSKYPELSQKIHTPVTDALEVALMRDGTPLSATVVRPKQEGRYPAILIRTPYGRAGMASYYGSLFAPRGYVVVSQDVRGMGGSYGEWDPFMNERKDGFDTVQWVAKQPWCDGNVGMIGGSYLGLVQWQAAVEQPPALKCMIPQVSPPDPFYNIPYDHGAFFLYPNAWWSKIVASKNADMAAAGETSPNPAPFATLPLANVDEEFLGKDVPFWNKWLERDTAAKWAGANYQADIKNVKIPALLISGWWDGDMAGTTMNWQLMRQAGHEKRWLIIGPWGHNFNTASKLADEDYGPEALLELGSVYVRFFDTYLKGKQVKFEDRARAQVFLTGSKEWRLMSDYPHKLSREKKLFLSSAKDARTDKSDGTLGDQPGDGQSTISYDPKKAAKPAPGPGNESFTFKFEDIVGDELYFKSEAMKQPLDMSGPINLSFSFKSNAQDCDFYALLMDVDPSGKIRLIHQGGKIRSSYIKSMDFRTPLVPDEIYKANISLWDVAHTFKPGHRIGLVISCNFFPTFDRNLGYADPPATATRMRNSKQTIFHNKEHPAMLSFQVMPPLE